MIYEINHILHKLYKLRFLRRHFISFPQFGNGPIAFFLQQQVKSLLILITFSFKDKLSTAMDDDGFSLLDRNSPAFSALVTSLIIFLGALIAAILLCELLLYLYQRFVKKKRTEGIKGG